MVGAEKVGFFYCGGAVRGAYKHMERHIRVLLIGNGQNGSADLLNGPLKLLSRVALGRRS